MNAKNQTFSLQKILDKTNVWIIEAKENKTIDGEKKKEHLKTP